MIHPGLVLETGKVLLRPLRELDFEPLLSLAREDESMWEYFTLKLADEKQLGQWLASAFADKAAGTRLPFTIIDKASGKVAGSTSMGNISAHDLRLEIGWSWLGKAFRCTGVNFHAKWAMMRFAFEELEFERVEFKTDVCNERAKNGLRKIGGIEEGVLRSHMTMWNGRRRSSVYFSVLKGEWPELRTTIFKELTNEMA